MQFAHVFFASAIAAPIGGLYEEQVSASSFWLIHAAIVAGGGLALPAFGGPLRRLLSAGIGVQGTQVRGRAATAAIPFRSHCLE